MPGLFLQKVSCAPGPEAEGTELQLPTEIPVPLWNGSHIPPHHPAQTNTATRTANPPTGNAGTQSEDLFEHKLLLRCPFMGLFPYLWPLGRQEGCIQNLSHCLFAEVIPSMQYMYYTWLLYYTWLFAFTKCIRENNLFGFNSFKMEISFTGRRAFHRNRVCTLWRFQKDLRNNIK